MALVTNDPVAVHARFAAANRIAYTLLADEKSSIIRAFGLIDPRFPPASRWHGLALPIIFVIDPRGVITHRFSGTDTRDRPDVGAVLRELKRAPGG